MLCAADPFPEKIKLRPEDNVNRVLREVNSLSRVSHQYIVRYYSCWLEEVGPPEPISAGDETMTASTISSESEDIFAVNFDDLSVSRRDHSRSASFPRIRFAGSDDDDEDEDDSDASDSDSDTTTTTSSTNTADPSDRRSRSRAVAIPSKSRPSTDYTGTTTDDGSVQRILYIQMEFVEKVSSGDVARQTQS